MKDWKGIAPFSSKEVPETIKRDARAYIQTLPAIERNTVQDDDVITYWEDGTGQHAVILQTPHDGQCWYYALIYGQDNRRIKVLKYSTGTYMS